MEVLRQATVLLDFLIQHPRDQSVEGNENLVNVFVLPQLRLCSWCDAVGLHRIADLYIVLVYMTNLYRIIWRATFLSCNTDDAEALSTVSWDFYQCIMGSSLILRIQNNKLMMPMPFLLFAYTMVPLTL